MDNLTKSDRLKSHMYSEKICTSLVSDIIINNTEAPNMGSDLLGYARRLDKSGRGYEVYHHSQNNMKLLLIEGDLAIVYKYALTF